MKTAEKSGTVSRRPPVRLLSSLASLARFRRTAPSPVVLVPTMGALHRGHAALIADARKRAGRSGTVVVSIFVNPTQFGPDEDFEAYPRPVAHDRKICADHGADAIFLPSVAEMYPVEASVFVEEGSLSRFLCGSARPGHFRGVCTVCTKLFHLVDPDVAIFGEKDFQQLAILRRMVRDLNFRVKIVEHPTVRESDGLALSSRNQYLTPEERAVAPRIQAALQDCGKRVETGERSAAKVVVALRRSIDRIPGARLDYAEVVDTETLAPVRRLDHPFTVAVSVFLGKARLIDHLSFKP